MCGSIGKAPPFKISRPPVRFLEWMSENQVALPPYEGAKAQEEGPTPGVTTPPPQYSQDPGYPTQPPPTTGYPTQPPPATGYPTQPPPATGYPTQPPPATGYPTQPPPAIGYPTQPPPPGPGGYPTQPPVMYHPTAVPQGVDSSNVVIVNQPGVVFQQTVMFRDAPVTCQCPNCNNQVTSNVHREIGGLTLLIAGALCIFGLWMFCCLIPFCIDACKDAVHTCPVCNHQLGRWTQL